MPIPKLIHQTWKTDETPKRWREAIESVRRLHPDWEYRLWTHADMDEYVRTTHPDFHPEFAGYSRDIMRADVFRYILMHDVGGLYCDLDFMFIRPYEYGGAELVLAKEFDVDFGDPKNCIANYVFASAPGHQFWRDVISELRTNPPVTSTYDNVVSATGPWFINGVFEQNRDAYKGVRIEEKLVFGPHRIHGLGKNLRPMLLNNGVTRGIHFGSGSWKERWTLTYLRRKIAKLLSIKR